MFSENSFMSKLLYTGIFVNDFMLDLMIYRHDVSCSFLCFLRLYLEAEKYWGNKKNY